MPCVILSTVHTYIKCISIYIYIHICIMIRCDTKYQANINKLWIYSPPHIPSGHWNPFLCDVLLFQVPQTNILVAEDQIVKPQRRPTSDGWRKRPRPRRGSVNVRDPDFSDGNKVGVSSINAVWPKKRFSHWRNLGVKGLHFWNYQLNQIQTLTMKKTINPSKSIKWLLNQETSKPLSPMILQSPSHAPPSYWDLRLVSPGRRASCTLLLGSWFQSVSRRHTVTRLSATVSVTFCSCNFPDRLKVANASNWGWEKNSSPFRSNKLSYLEQLSALRFPQRNPSQTTGSLPSGKLRMHSIQPWLGSLFLLCGKKPQHVFLTCQEEDLNPFQNWKQTR